MGFCWKLPQLQQQVQEKINQKLEAGKKASEMIREKNRRIKELEEKLRNNE